MAKKQSYRLIKGGKAADQKKKVLKAEAGTKKTGIVFGILLVVIGIAVGAFIYIRNTYHVKNVLVEGNVHYTREDIVRMVLKEKMDYNSLYLSFKYKEKQIRDIPFIQTMSVEVVSPDTIKIMVYEKTVAGYVEYMGKFIYFDRDGIVVESSGTRTASVPEVTGIRFDHVVLYEPLPVTDSSVFKHVLNITQISSKYDILADKIYFNEANEMTLYFGNVRVRLGSADFEEKIMRLTHILPNLEGLSGVLQMENYDDESENITFLQDENQ
ncbi:MAG: FtsQ-type POTRA domain-containing protein [Lachnospiraceae bacterium]|nr:FtsQ-type POTRA domain-containing protein [Lachnospiraceae bacterium]